MKDSFINVDSEGNVTWSDGSQAGIVMNPQYPQSISVSATTSSTTPSVNISNCTFNGSMSGAVESVPVSPFRKLNKEEQNRLAHVLGGDRIHLRVKKPDLIDNKTMPDYKLGIEISDTEDFLVHVNMINAEANTLGDIFDVEHIAETLCTMLTLSGSEVIKDGQLFSPPSIS